VYHVDPDFPLEQLAADVVAGADAGGGIGEFAGVLPRVFDEFGHIVDGQRRMYSEHECDVRCPA
jgi:hypothetical protein